MKDRSTADLHLHEESILAEHEVITKSLFEGVSPVKPAHITDDALSTLASTVRPSSRQMRFSERGMHGFVHFSVNTFTGNEWGTGTEHPDVFNPDLLNTDEWIWSFRKAGITGVTLVAKHHDGFCLWPSKYTDHSVKNSAWRNGAGDVVREFTESCKRYNTTVGIYYSPWDRHEETYGTEAYNEYMINQLEELLTEYGPVEIVWFDGAGQDPNTSGTYMAFDWPRIYRAIRGCQPWILIDGGIDTRWVGNESGQGRKTQWSVQSIDTDDILEMSSFVHGLELKSEELGKLSDLRKGKILHWLQARGGTPTRAGWFWHENTDHTVRTLRDAVDIYFSSTGQNSPIQYNLAPDNRGRIPEGERQLFEKLGSYLREMYRTDYAASATVAADREIAGSNEFSPARIIEKSPYTCWIAAEGATAAELLFTLPEQRRFNVIKLQENIRDCGQRIGRFSIDARNADGSWTTVYQGTTIGYRRLIRVPTLETDGIRIRLEESRSEPSLSRFALYFAPHVAAPPEIQRSDDGFVSLSRADDISGEIRYTTDGTVPTPSSACYDGPFDLSGGGTVRAMLFVDNTRDLYDEGEPAHASKTFGKAPVGWSVANLLPGETDHPTSRLNVLTSNPLENWDTRRLTQDLNIDAEAASLREVVIDMQKEHEVRGFLFAPAGRQYKGMIIPAAAGLIRFYDLHISDDNDTWVTVVSNGEFSNIENNPVQQMVEFDPVRGRYVKFRAKASVDGEPYFSASSLQIMCTEE